MKIIVTGKTWIYRERLKEMGGRYDANEKLWRFDYATKEDIRQIRIMPGCTVAEDKPQTADEFISEIINHSYGSTTGNQKTIFYGDDVEFYNLFRDKNPISFFGFSSLSNLVKFIENIPEEKRYNVAWEKTKDYLEFSATENMDHAIDLAKNGWKEGVENAERVSQMIKVSHALQKKRKHLIAGGSVNVGRLLTGNPMHMKQRTKQPGKKIITLFVQNNGLSNIKAKSMIARSAICCALVDLLEVSGYSCELISVTANRISYHGSPANHSTVCLKNAGEKINISEIAFALGHPSFLRRFNFALIGQAIELKKIWQTMGVSSPAFCENSTEIYIPHLTQNYKGETIEEIAKEMLSDILPKNLPLEIKI